MQLTYQQATIEYIAEAICQVNATIPEFTSTTSQTTLYERLSNPNNSLILVARNQTQVVGYKAGYAESSSLFYSWLGAVLPEYRQQGVATTLRVKQEQWARENGYNAIKVKSMNRFPAMLQMLINNQYHISGYEDRGSPQNSKICFIKTIT